VLSDVEVQDFPASVLNDEEAVEQAEGHGWYRKKVERNDRLAMVQEEAQPLFPWDTTAVCGPKIPGDGSFRNNETELLEFSVDLGGTPIRVLSCHAQDEISDFLCDLRPATWHPGSPAPVPTKTGAVPADNGGGPHDDEGVCPPRPEAPEGRPEETVQGLQCWPRSLAFEHRDLLSQGEYLQSDFAATSKEDANGGQYRENEFKHQTTLVTSRNVTRKAWPSETATC
jgi:hypothetical protein